MSNAIKHTVIVFLVACTTSLFAQDVYHHISNTNVYHFLDELSNQRIIEINSEIKPFSRKYIATKLAEANSHRDQLNRNQQKQLDFLLKDFNKELLAKKTFKKRLDLFYYKDSLFNCTVNPVGGFSYFKNDNDNMYRQYAGGEFWATIGKYVGFYGSLRDNTDSRAIADSYYRNNEPGYNYKYEFETDTSTALSSKTGGSFDETRGGVTASWDWGTFGIIKDNIVWGTNYAGSNIISDKAPSFPMINLKVKPVKWLEFNYIHGWLSSEVLDSSRFYNAGNNQRRIVYHPKFIAANMFTVTPFKRLNISVGNSIVYADDINIGMFTPVLFYKSVEHTMNGQRENYSGQNSQMFLEISSHNIKYVHLYGSLFIDELDLGNAFDEKKQSNFFSMKAGLAASPKFIPNTTIILEYTRTNPITYTHFVNSTNYTTNQFTMGHYLGDNSQEFYFGIRFRPLKKLYVDASYSLAQIGEQNIYTGKDRSGLGIDFLPYSYYDATTINLKLRYEVINDVFIVAGVSSRNHEGVYAQNYTAPFYYGKDGKTTTAFGGFNIGF